MIVYAVTAVDVAGSFGSPRLAVGRELPGAAGALDEAAPPLMTAELLSDLPPARKAVVTSAVGLRPVPRLPLQITAQLTVGRVGAGQDRGQLCVCLVGQEVQGVLDHGRDREDPAGHHQCGAVGNGSVRPAPQQCRSAPGVHARAALLAWAPTWPGWRRRRRCGRCSGSRPAARSRAQPGAARSRLPQAARAGRRVGYPVISAGARDEPAGS
jgi:hypothetical protein